MDSSVWNAQVCHGNDEDGYTERAVTFETRDEAIQFVEDYLEELDAACESQAANNGVIRIWSSAANQLIEI